MGGGEGGLLEFQFGGLPVEEGGVGAEGELLDGPGLEEGFDDAAAFEFGDVEPEVWGGLEGGVDHGGAGVEDHDAGFGDVFEKSRERFEIDGGGLQGGVLGALVFELGDDLERDARGDGGFEEVAEGGVGKGVAVEAGVEAEGFHAVGLLAAFEVVLPAGMGGVEGADGEEEVGGGFGAVGGEAGVDGGEVGVEEGVEAAGPGLGDAFGAEVVGESGGGVVWEAVVGPAVEVEVDVGDAG